MNKFNKTYRLTIQMDENTDAAIVIQPPFTVSFDITRNTMAQANTATFQIYNLGNVTRKKIFQDLFDLSSIRKVIFEAGYNDKLSTIFVGNLRTAYSRRQGTEIITECYCWDDGSGSMLTQFTNKTYSAGWTQKDILKTQMGSLKNVNMGEVGDFSTTPSPRGVSIVGNTYAVLNKHADGLVFIDLNTIHALNNNECIEGLVPKIDSSTGLLGTPKRQDAKLSLDMIFEPRIVVGQVIEVESTVQTEYNGQYKVIGIHHTGLMSESVAGECKTELQMFIPDILNNQGLNLVKDGKIIPITQKFSKAVRADIEKSIKKWGLKYGVDINFIKAIIRQESGFNPNARSNAGALGIMQLMPANCRSLGVTRPFDYDQNIHGGVNLLRGLLRKYNGQMDLAAAAYNAGSGAVDRYGGVPPYKETRHYVRAVLGNYYVYSGKGAK